MPKMKTRRSAKKRYKVTGTGKKTGKVKRAHAFKSHILNKKTTKRKRNLRAAGVLEECEAKNVRKMLPYG